MQCCGKTKGENMFSPLDPSAFSGSDDFYIAEFESILTKIVCCYKMMICNGDTVPNEEEKIRDNLYIRYLNNNRVRNQIGFNFNIVCEPAEYLNGECSGYVDLRIFSRNSLTDTSAYYIIECKRLDSQNLIGKTGLNAEYITNGIMRFVSGKYSTNKYLNGMIGFVVERMDIARNIESINTLLYASFSCANTLTKLMATRFIKDFDYSYYSIHKRSGCEKNIKLYHLMFDFSGNMDANK